MPLLGAVPTPPAHLGYHLTAAEWAARPIPVVPWTENRELLAWRAWRLGFLLRRQGGDGGPRLLSLTASCIWNGPVVRAGVPVPSTDQPNGIYALKPEVADRLEWQNEHC